MARASSREGESLSAPRVLDGVELVERGGSWNAFGEDADGVLVLACGAGGGVAADDVVIEDGFEIPGFGSGEFGEVAAAVETLLFSGHGDEDDCGGKLELGEGAGGLDGDGGSGGVVVGARGGVMGVEVVGGAGVVVAGDEDAAGLLGGGRCREGWR